MSHTIVIYASRYGSTRQYAEWIAQALGCQAKQVSDCKGLPLDEYDTVVFGGGLYAGSVNGLPFLARHLERRSTQRVILFTVGLSPTDNPAVFRPTLEKALSPQALAGMRLFHLRGEMDKRRLSLVHRAMISAMSAMLRRIPADRRTEEEAGMFRCISTSQNFMDRESIRPLVEYATAP